MGTSAWFGGFIERAGERAHEQNLLDLTNEQQRRKDLADFYRKWSEDAANKPWSRQLASQRVYQIQSTPYTKKLPKDVEDVQSLFKKIETYQGEPSKGPFGDVVQGGQSYQVTEDRTGALPYTQPKEGPTLMRDVQGVYTPEEQIAMEASRTRAVKGAEAEAGWPTRKLEIEAAAEAGWPTRQKEIELMNKGKTLDENQESGESLLARGIIRDRAGQPIDPKATYNVRTIWGSTEPEITLIPESYSNTLQYEFFVDDEGNVIGARPYQTGTYGGRRYMDVAEGTIPRVPQGIQTGSEAVSWEDPFMPGYRGTGTQRTVTSKMRPLSELQQGYTSPSGAVSLRPEAGAPPTAKGGGFSVGHAPLARPVSIRTLNQAWQEVRGKDLSSDVMAALPAAEIMSQFKGVNDPDRIAALDTFNSLVNYYPSTHWAPLVEQLKPEMVPVHVRGSLETIKDKILEYLDNPSRMQDDDFKGDTGVIVRNAMGALGIPVATKVAQDQANKAAYAMTTLQAIRQMRQIVLHHPKFIGAVAGRVGYASGQLGVAPLTDFVDEATRQEIITRLKYFVIMEAKVLMGSRPAVSWARKLEEVSAGYQHTLGQFLGALRGAEQHAYNVLREAEEERWGARWQEMQHVDAPFMPGAVQEGDIRVNPGHTIQGSLMTGKYNTESVQDEWINLYNKVRNQDYEMVIKDPSTGDLWWAYPSAVDPATGQFKRDARGKPVYDPTNINTGPYASVERIHRGVEAPEIAPPPGR